MKYRLSNKLPYDQICCFDKNYITKEMDVDRINELEEMRIKDRNGK